MALEFEWDEAKREKNRAERGFGFDYAAQIFLGEVLEEEDQRRDWGEPRFVATGIAEQEFFVVVYTWRGYRRRIISARPASRRERNAYRKAFLD